ncbi:hypothetical protein EON65_50900 [archaeon]|nr:MAG: hypothetical protein EON65_50900 [archaeon]
MGKAPYYSVLLPLSESQVAAVKKRRGQRAPSFTKTLHHRRLVCCGDYFKDDQTALFDQYIFARLIIGLSMLVTVVVVLLIWKVKPMY